jgi:hypothetical protein
MPHTKTFCLNKDYQCTNNFNLKIDQTEHKQVDKKEINLSASKLKIKGLEVVRIYTKPSDVRRVKVGQRCIRNADLYSFSRISPRSEN